MAAENSNKSKLKTYTSTRKNTFTLVTLQSFSISGVPGGGGYSQKNWVGVCGPLPKTLTPFMTKICHITYPIYDLTFKSKPCF